MNVNPFSYLIEKLKGKVDKSGDTVTGNLYVARTDGSDSFLGVGRDSSRGVFSITNGSDKTAFIVADNLTSNRGYNLPDNDGTFALKSDIPTQNKLTSYETIDSYNSASNKYTCPSDGYIYVSNSTNANDGGVLISGSDDTNFLIMGGNKGYFPLFVRKGMKCYCYGNIEHAYFFPLS